MTKPVEFSIFFKALNAAKEGDKLESKKLSQLIEAYKNCEESDSALYELGQTFLYVGITELFKYAESNDLVYIGNIDQDGWEEIADKNKGELPPHLANTMIQFAKENNLPSKIHEKWGMPKRKVEENIMQMARYITEGIIDSID